MKTNDLLGAMGAELSNVALKLHSGWVEMILSAGFGFMITLMIFKSSTFFLFVTWENFFLFYIMTIVIGLINFFIFGKVVGLLKKISS